MSQTNYSIRIPYNQAESLVSRSKHWNFDDFIDYVNLHDIKDVENITDIFREFNNFLGEVTLSICPKNFDLIVDGKIGDFATSGDYECCNPLWESLSECTRDFQLVIDLTKDDFYKRYKNDEKICPFAKKILRKKDGKFEIYYVDSKNRVQKESYGRDEKYLDIDPSIFEKHFCDEGTGEDYSRLLTEDEKSLVYSQLRDIYGLQTKKKEYIKLLDRLDIK